MLRKLSKYICQLNRGAKEFSLFQTLKLGRKKKIPRFLILYLHKCIKCARGIGISS